MTEFQLPPIFKYFLDQMPEAVYIVDENQKILFLNQYAESLTGNIRGQMLGKSCREVFGKIDNQVYCAFDDFKENDQERVARRTTIKLKDGAQVPVEMCLVRAPEEIAGRPLIFGTIKKLSVAEGPDAQDDHQKRFGNILTKSPAMLKIFSLIDAIADTEVNVLIQGESGTGKELIARAIHENSPRKKGPFHDVNCGALTLELLDSEIFGHEKGAFTGAIKQKPGRLELANGGTLFLDEVGDMPPSLQVKLLRVLQERKFERVGGTVPLDMDARIIAATNVDLDNAVRTGRFRQDLFFRLNVVPIQLPPLRDRTEDIETIANHYLAQFSESANRPARRLAPETRRLLLNHSWPGNVRELINTVEYAVAVSPGEVIMPQDLPQNLQTGGSLRSVPITPNVNESLGVAHNFVDEEKQRILDALVKNGFRRDQTAKALGMSRTTLWRKMRELGIG